MFDLTFTTFNILEGFFWFAYAIGTLYASKRIRLSSKVFWYVLFALFVLFGISDFLEAFFDISFFDKGNEWLLAWKTVCIIGFIYCFLWYIRLRSSSV